MNGKYDIQTLELPPQEEGEEGGAGGEGMEEVEGERERESLPKSGLLKQRGRGSIWGRHGRG